MVFHAHPGPRGGVYLLKVYNSDKDLYWKYVPTSRRIQLATVDETEGSASLVFKWHIIPNSDSSAFTIRPAYDLDFSIDKDWDHPKGIQGKSDLDWRIEVGGSYSSIKYDDDNNDDILGCSTADLLLKLEYPDDSKPNQRFVFQPAVARYTQFFGYGSNIGDEQMKERCPDHLYSCIAKLDGWKWIINSRKVATIVPSPGDHVWGTVLLLHAHDEKSLDKEEGSRYVKTPVTVHLNGVKRNPGAVVTYIDPNTVEGRPCPSYVRRLEAAKTDGIAKGIPPEYFERYWTRFLQNPATDC